LVSLYPSLLQRAPKTIHDKFDKVIPIEKTKNVSSFIKNSKLIEIEGTGHFKMLWSKKVVKIIEELILSHSTKKIEFIR